MDIDPPPTAAATTSSITTTATSTTAVESNAIQIPESIKLEHQLLRVPFECYKDTIRTNHRTFEKDISSLISAVDFSSPDFDPLLAVDHFSSLSSRIRGLKRKLDEGSQAEDMQAQRNRARLDQLESANADNMHGWNNTRLRRILVDYMLRMSYYESAVKLAETNSLQDLVDIDAFGEARKVIEALQNKKMAPALTWCADNKSRLRKSKSQLEFQLRLQEFVEMVRADNNLLAIKYARKYLAPWAATHMKELQRVVATLAFKSSTDCNTYKVLFEPRRWNHLVHLFKQEFYRLNGFTPEPLLNIYLQAGLSVLKTPFCNESDCPRDDPLSQENFHKLASNLPSVKQQHSKIVCYINKELMDAENPPLVLPNGYVYSSKALEEMARRNNGQITCPRTGLACSYGDLAKAYIS